MNSKKFLRGLVAALLVFAAGSGLAVAAAERSLSLPSSQSFATDLLEARQTIDVGSDVAGDVMLAGNDVSYSGHAAGDVLIVGGKVHVRGASDGDVRLAGGTLSLDGEVARNVTVAGGSVIIEEGSVIHGNLYVVGGTVELRGTVDGNATVYSSQIQFSGQVLGNADLRGSELIVRPDARVGGNLTYASNMDLPLGHDIVKGAITKMPLQEVFDSRSAAQARQDASVVAAIWSFFSLLVAAYVFCRFFSKQMRELAVPIRKEEVWNRLAYGLLSFVLNAAVIFITFISLIGLPLALLILFVFIVFIIIAAVLAPVLVGKAANLKLRLYAPAPGCLLKDFILGYVLMELVKLIPFVGALALAVLFLFAFGRVSQYAIGILRANK